MRPPAPGMVHCLGEGRTLRHITLLLSGLILWALPAFAASPAPVRPEIYPLAEVKPGLEATGWTVLSGTEPVPFHLTVQGVLQQDSARGPLLLCEVSGQGLESMGVLAAMSGSPVYAGDRLLGAVAYTWPFSKKALCGVTPATALVNLLEEERPGAADAPGGGRPIAISTLIPPQSASPTSLPSGERAQGPLAALESAGFSWSGPDTQKRRDAVTPVPAPGGMISVQLVGGDLEFAAYGTLAVVKGDKFVAFGHPFMRLGPVELPVASARVDGLMPSLERGFKFCSAGDEMGMVHLDASAGVAGSFAKRARILPLELRLQRTGFSKEYRVRLARHPLLTPLLLQSTLLQVQGELEGVADPKTVTLRLAFRLPGNQRLELNPMHFSGPTPFAPLNEFASGVLDLLLNNPRDPVAVEGVEVTMESRPGLSGGILASAWPETAQAVPGTPLLVHAALEPFRAPTRNLALPLDTSLWPEGEIQLWVGDAFSLYKKLDGTEAVQPRRGEELLAFLRELPSNDHLYVAAVFPAADGRTLGGRRLDAAPPSLNALLGKDSPAGTSPTPFRLLGVTAGPFTGPFESLLVLTVPVRRPPPS